MVLMALASQVCRMGVDLGPVTRPSSHLGPLVAIAAVLPDSVNALHVIAAFQPIAFQGMLLKLKSLWLLGVSKLRATGGPRTNLETSRLKG